jgi:hypothetical protein
VLAVDRRSPFQRWILTHSITDVLFLTFAEARDDGTIVDLCPNGRTREVTDANKFEYVEALVEHTLVKSSDSATQALLAGVSQVLPLHCLRPLSTPELQDALAGSADVDPTRMLQHARFTGGYSATDPTVVALVQILQAWPVEDVQRYVCSRRCCSCLRSNAAVLCSVSPQVVGEAAVHE